MVRVILLLLVVSIVGALPDRNEAIAPCSSLSPWHYDCEAPEIDPQTQQPTTCAPDNSYIAKCRPAVYIPCSGLTNNTYFNKKIENGCEWNTHLKHSTAVLLSIFFGILGIDRFYLGYYAIGLLKMFSLGGLFIFWLVDVVLITLQILEPADGSKYLMPYYGPKVTQLRFNGHTNYTTYTCVDCL